VRVTPQQTHGRRHISRPGDLIKAAGNWHTALLEFADQFTLRELRMAWTTLFLGFASPILGRPTL
jgi:hypothetical protein